MKRLGAIGALTCLVPLRMHLNVTASEELRMNLLGQSSSMRAPLTVGHNPPR